MSDLRTPASEAYPVHYAGFGWGDELPDHGDDGERECTICNGDGVCDANASPLWDCDDNDHPCHACGGTGNRRDQRYF